MSSQLGAISSINNLIGKVFTQPKGDLAARLNSRITVVILAISASLLLTTHFWGEPITCWTPAEFPKIWTDLVNQYCYVHGTYFASLDGPLDWNKRERQHIFINYYQWIPYVLAIQAIFFYIPKFIWKILSGFSGYDLPSAIQYVDLIWRKIKTSNFQARMKTMEEQAAVFLWDGIKLSRRRNRGRLLSHYVLYSILQAINSTLMFFWLNVLIDSPIYSWKGPSILIDLFNGYTWQETGHFPRITHCDFSRRKFASIQIETVLCVLTLNIYYEKFLLFLWFWMLFVAIVSWINCINWTKMVCIPLSAKTKLQSYLNIHCDSSIYLNQFFQELGADGIFILHQMAINIGDLPTSYLTLAMYNSIDRLDNIETMQLVEKRTKII